MLGSGGIPLPPCLREALRGAVVLEELARQRQDDRRQLADYLCHSYSCLSPIEQVATTDGRATSSPKLIVDCDVEAQACRPDALRPGDTVTAPRVPQLTCEARAVHGCSMPARSGAECDDFGLGKCINVSFVRPNVRGKREATARRQARAAENVARRRPGLVTCCWLSA